MEITQSLLSVTPLYAALLGLLFIPFTMRVGFYRLSSKIFVGDGGDDEMVRRMRSQANFIETVPLALILIVVMELMGAGSYWLHGLGALLVVARLLHYLGMSGIGPELGRPIGMFGTFSVYLISCGWVLYSFL
ncbi:MAG: MAPEG family protein [Halioglobus sp.]